MKLCLLETDTNTDMQPHWEQSYLSMFQDWLSPALPEAQWTGIAVHEGAELPDPGAFDGYLITGSRHGVYDDLPWMAPLADFIRECRTQGRPMGGICFGHQIMAHAYGAKVEKSGEGWLLGARSYAGKSAFAWHQDQVQNVPDGARDVVAAQGCPIARLSYEFPALSVQYHPEFTPDFMALLLDMYGDGHIDTDVVAGARSSLNAPLQVSQIAEDFAQFFRTHTVHTPR